MLACTRASKRGARAELLNTILKIVFGMGSLNKGDKGRVLGDFPLSPVPLLFSPPFSHFLFGFGVRPGVSPARPVTD